MKTKLRLHTGEQQAKIVQDFQSFFEVARIALGSEDKGKTDLKPAQTVEEVRAGFARVFG